LKNDKYPEIEALNLTDTRDALNLGYLNLPTVMQTGQDGGEADLRARLAALETHYRELKTGGLLKALKQIRKIAYARPHHRAADTVMDIVRIAEAAIGETEC
jgi:hypothetical protein